MANGITVYFYVFDLPAANKMKLLDKAEGRRGVTRDASTFVRYMYPEACDRVVIMPDVPKHLADKVREVYGNLVKELDPDLEEQVMTPPTPVLDTQPQTADANMTFEDSLNAMTRRQIRDFAQGKGWTLPITDTKEVLIFKILRAMKAEETSTPAV